MEQVKVMLSTVDIMNKTEAVLDTIDDLVKDPESHGSVREDIIQQIGAAAGDTPASDLPCTECNDGERAILASYVSLMRQCIELAERVGAAKA